MSYRIVYGPMPRTGQPRDRSMLRVQIWTAVFLLVFSLLVRQLWPEGRAVLGSFFLPGAPTEMEQAVAVMVADLRDGMSLEGALTAFCRQIIYGEVS